MHRLAPHALAGALLVLLAAPACDTDPCAGGNICTWAGNGRAAFNGEGEPLSQATFYWPIDVKITSSGDTYILDWNSHKVRRLQDDGTLRTIVGTDFVGDGDYATKDLSQPGVQGTEINLNHPTQLLERPDGSLILVSWHNHKLRHVDVDTGMVYVMGGRGAGFAGDGGPLDAPDLRFNQPSGGVIDEAGNIYLVDQRNQVVRRISADLKLVETIAGTQATPGYSGDGGDPLAARFSFPKGSNPPPAGTMALDRDGNLYVADTLNHAVRKISADRETITTLVGDGTPGDGPDGPVDAARLNNPRDLEIGPDGRLYIADEMNHRVRAVDLAAGTITTVAGTGEPDFSGDGGPATAAALNRPTGIEFDAAGTLYIADSHNNRIRTVGR